MRSRGSLSAMVVCLVPSLFTLAALSIDGGRMVVAYQRASDAAASAARDGAQEIVGILDGHPHINERRASEVARGRIEQLGYEGSASASPTSVRVTVARRVHLPLLALIGLGDRRVVVTRDVDVVFG